MLPPRPGRRLAQVCAPVPAVPTSARLRPRARQQTETHRSAVLRTARRVSTSPPRRRAARLTQDPPSATRVPAPRRGAGRGRGRVRRRSRGRLLDRRGGARGARGRRAAGGGGCGPGGGLGCGGGWWWGLGRGRLLLQLVEAQAGERRVSPAE